MGLLEKLHAGVDASANLPFVRDLVRRQARERFIANRDQNLFHGVYASWEEAAEAAAAFGKAGYDNTASARLYNHRTRMDQHDHPSLYWLYRLQIE